MSDAPTPDDPADAAHGVDDETDDGDSSSADTDGADGQHGDGVNETERRYGVDENPS